MHLPSNQIAALQPLPIDFDFDFGFGKGCALHSDLMAARMPQI
jgi:hypothetical protein